MIHCAVHEDSPFNILDILEAEGADISHTVLAHMDRAVRNPETILKLAKRGCWLEYDLFGLECSHSCIS